MAVRLVVLVGLVIIILVWGEGWERYSPLIALLFAFVMSGQEGLES